jgi:hypothetical protein
MNPRPHRPAPPTDKGLYVAYALLGKKEGDRYFMRSGSSPVYTISARQLGQLPKVPEDFKG